VSLLNLLKKEKRNQAALDFKKREEERKMGNGEREAS